MPVPAKAHFEGVAAGRLSFGEWSDEANDYLGVGDVTASYSADSIANESRVRKPFAHRGSLYVSVGGTSHAATAYRLTPAGDFGGEPTTYRSRCEAGDAARSDPMGFYHGVKVRRGRAWYVLTGPKVTFHPSAAAGPEQLTLFGPGPD